jgi:acetoin utilization protein AcuB
MKRVADVMTHDPKVIGPDSPIGEALRSMREGGFRRLPVVEGGRLVGILSDRDLRQAMNIPMIVREKHYDDYVLGHVQVGTCMTAEVLVLSPQDSLEKAAKLMRDKKVGGCPVLEDGRLVGMITESDLLGYLIECLERGMLI